ncbi:MAG: biotin synthase BioB [Candidatus Omnitrophica bacterium]|nr:biotin synthase BioB [Candidatus Omnitrophota bacterium]
MEVLKTSLTELMAQAHKIRKESIGEKLELCSIINAKSGLCGEDCKFCAQSSRHNADISKYPLKGKNEIVRAAETAKDIGAGRFGIVTSGNKLTPKELDEIAGAVRDIKRDVGIAVCGSLGALKKDELAVLKDAGLSRYHHNIETSPNFYSKIVTTHGFQERINTINAAKERGLEVCSGGIIGMGETWQDRIDIANLLMDLDVDSVPINFLIPMKGTPLESAETISCNDAIRTISIFRIILKEKTIKIAAGRETVLKDSQKLGFLAGANGMLIGGYLTVKGRDVEADQELIREIKRVWTE